MSCTSLKNIFFLLLIAERGKERRKRGREETSMWERDINWLPLKCPQLGNEPPIQAYALTGNQPGDLSPCWTRPNPLNHTGQSRELYFCWFNWGVKFQRFGITFTHVLSRISVPSLLLGTEILYQKLAKDHVQNSSLNISKKTNRSLCPLLSPFFVLCSHEFYHGPDPRLLSLPPSWAYSQPCHHSLSCPLWVLTSEITIVSKQSLLHPLI